MYERADAGTFAKMKSTKSMDKGYGNKMWKIIEKIAYFVLNIFFSLFKKELTEDIFLSFMQFVKFGIVGLSNTMICYALYAASLLGFQRFHVFPEEDYLIAQVIAFLLSVLWSFYWNNKMVFTVEDGKSRAVWKALLKTYAAYSFTGLFLNSILLIFWVRVVRISEFLAPALNLLVSVPLNFIINKFWAFKEG